MDGPRSGSIVPFAVGTLIIFYLVWAAIHDIAHGDEGTVELVFLVLSVAAFALLYRRALRVLPAGSRLLWLIGTGLLIGLFSGASVSAMVRPKYPKDQMLGFSFILAALPAILLIAFHVYQAIRRLPIRKSPARSESE